MCRYAISARASRLAGKNTIPATVRNLTDAEANEVQVGENLQRENIHELDEGIGYRSLMELRPDFYTVEATAAHVAKSPAYMRGLCSTEHKAEPYVVKLVMWR